MENQETNIASDSERLQAAIDAVEGAPEEASIGITAQEEVEQENSEKNGVPLDDDQPVTPGEENVEAALEASEPEEAESSKLASLARRERRIREQAKEREGQLAKKEQELENRLKKAEELEARLNRMKDEFKYDPVSALKDLGIEDGYADVASALYDEELGEDAPAGSRQNREIRALKERLKKFEADQQAAIQKREEEQKAAENQAFQRKYVGEMESYMDSKDENLTYANALYGESPQEAVQAMYTIAYNTALENPNDPVLTAKELAEALNHNLEKTLAPVIDAILAARNQTEDKPQATKEPVKQTKTLRNAQSRRTTQQSPAQTEEERIKRALQALG